MRRFGGRDEAGGQRARIDADQIHVHHGIQQQANPRQAGHKAEGATEERRTRSTDGHHARTSKAQRQFIASDAGQRSDQQHQRGGQRDAAGDVFDVVAQADGKGEESHQPGPRAVQFP